jgi:alpha-1,6-mannosyltransferase
MGTGRTSPRAAVALATLVAGYLVVALVAGAPGSPLLPLLPDGARVPGWAGRGAAVLALDRLGTPGLTVVGIAVLAGLVAAFGVVLVEAWRGRAGLGAVLVAVSASLILATVAPLLLSRDVNAYAAYGRTYALYGSNPYVEPPSAFPADPFARAGPGPWRDTPSLYGPAFTLVSAGIARGFDGSPGATIAAFKVLAGGAVAVAVLLVARAARIGQPGREALAAAALGLNPVVVVHTVGGGHNEGMIVALLAGALVVAVARGGEPPTGLERQALAVTTLLTVAALVKSVLVIPLLLWVWALTRSSPRARRGRVAGTHLGLATLIAVVLFAPFLEGVRSLAALGTLASVEGWASGPALVARGAREIGEALGGQDAADALAAVVVAVFLALVLVLLGRLGRRGTVHPPGREWVRGPMGPAAVWGAALLVFALGAPYLAPWYAAWFLPFLVMGDGRLAMIGLAASGLLALTGVPAEAASEPALYDGARLAVHYVAAPIMLALFALAARRVLDMHS